MGLCFAHCVTKQIKSIREDNIQSSYLIGDVPLRISTTTVLEDCPFFFEVEDWYKITAHINGAMFFDPDKFLDFYPNYKNDQTELLIHWNEADLNEFLRFGSNLRKKTCLNSNWKFLLRKGVPLRYMRKVILHLFQRDFSNNEGEYQAVLKVIYSGRIPKEIKKFPTFCESETFEQALKYHCLTKQGIYALKRILWVIKETCFFLNYSPMIIQILNILLIFLTEAEAYFCIKTMIETSKFLLDENEEFGVTGSKAMRWYITLEAEDFGKMCSAFFDIVQEKSLYFNQILEYFTKNDYDHITMFQEWIKHVFHGVFPFSLVLKIFTSYLNEGIKIYFRASYGILYMFKDEILNGGMKDHINEEIQIRANSFSLKETHKLLKIAFTLSLTNMKSTFSQMSMNTSFIVQNKGKVIYRPKVDKPSNIISDEQFETIWEYLPHANKFNDAELVFSTFTDGFSLAHLYQKCINYNDSIIIIIKNDQKYVFGAFVDATMGIDLSILYRGTRDSFVFSLSPFEQKFESTGFNNEHLRCESDYFSMGSDGDGVAFYIDKDLLNGHSYRSETYNNFPFLEDPEKSSFHIIALELYALV